MDNIKNYECNICNKKYKSKQSLWNHNNKFHKKDKIQEYICKHCNESFDNRHKKCYHQKKCQNQNVNLQNIDTNNQTNNIVPENNKTIITNNGNNNNNITNNGSINQNIVINNYGNDNLEYITERFKLNLFDHLLKYSDHPKPIPKLIENIKFNPNHKENNNVKITSDRSKIGFYYNNNQWKAINKEQLLDNLCDYSLKIFTQYFEEYKDNLSENIKLKYRNFSQMSIIKSQLRKEMKKGIENVAYIFSKNNDYELDK